MQNLDTGWVEKTWTVWEWKKKLRAPRKRDGEGGTFNETVLRNVLRHAVLALWIKVSSVGLCLSLVSFQDEKVCSEDPRYARREGYAIAVGLWCLRWSWTYLNRATKQEKHKD